MKETINDFQNLKKYRLSLTSGEDVIFTSALLSIIDVIDFLTKEKFVYIFTDNKEWVYIFRKHIVKITEAK